jgi:hypothetical protein
MHFEAAFARAFRPNHIDRFKAAMQPQSRAEEANLRLRNGLVAGYFVRVNGPIPSRQRLVELRRSLCPFYIPICLVDIQQQNIDLLRTYAGCAQMDQCFHDFRAGAARRDNKEGIRHSTLIRTSRA